MIKKLMSLVLLVGVVFLVTVACGGGDDEEQTVSDAAKAQALSSDLIALREASKDDEVRSGVTGIDENGVIQYSIYVEGGGAGTGEKSAQYGAAGFTYDVDEITFKVGDTVHFTAIPPPDPKQQHTFIIQEFSALARMKFGKSGEVTVTFDRAGSFKFQCREHTGYGEFGTIIVQ